MPKELIEWVESLRIVSQAVCQPAVRMFYVTVGRDPDDDESGWTTIYPVLALHSTVFDQYRRKGIVEYVLPYTHEEAEEKGWRYMGQEQRNGMLVNDDDYGLVSTDDPLMSNENEATGFVYLPWPYDEVKDKAEIDKCVAAARKHLEWMLKERMARQAERAAKQDPAPPST